MLCPILGRIGKLVYSSVTPRVIQMRICFLY
uniref:Uncharacterized protein n=1 Tax=Rhizophora mucronata TaxID=61149 RepID=A0A2P2PWW4_RHIMU